MATALQVKANRENAKLSTGPATPNGKVTASRNAIRHGLRSEQVVLENEDAAEYDALTADLVASLVPVGTIEEVLVERIAVCLWRQRRLVAAETAELNLEQRPSRIARDLGWLNEAGVGYNVDLDELEHADDEQLAWCREVIAEFEALEGLELEMLAADAPKIFGQLKSDASDDQQSIEAFLHDIKSGLRGYVFDLVQWCQTQLGLAEKRPRLLALANQCRQKRLTLRGKQLEVLARYQTSLDNQLYKALRALREAQEWRKGPT